MASSAPAAHPPKTLLVCLDGSACSLDALKFAKRCLVRGDRLILLSAYTDNPNAHDSWSLYGLDVLVAARHRSEEILKKATELLEQSPVPDTLSVYCEDPREAIVRVSKEEDVDGIVMGARGLGTIAQLCIGSVSNYVLHNAHVPVTIVRHPTATHQGLPTTSCVPPPQDRGFVLVPTDGSPGSIQALLYACKVCRPEDKLMVLSVFRASGNQTQDEVKRLQATSALAVASNALRSRCIAPTTHIVEEVRVASKSVQEEIVDFALQNGASCIVMGAKGTTSLLNLAVGSVSSFVLEHAPCPVTIARN